MISPIISGCNPVMYNFFDLTVLVYLSANRLFWPIFLGGEGRGESVLSKTRTPLYSHFDWRRSIFGEANHLQKFVIFMEIRNLIGSLDIILAKFVEVPFPPSLIIIEYYHPITKLDGNFLVWKWFSLVGILIGSAWWPCYCQYPNPINQSHKVKTSLQST